MITSLVVSIFYCKSLHCLFKVLTAFEITADVICFSAYCFSSAYRRGKDIAILVIVDIAENFNRICHHSFILLVHLFFVFAFRRSENKRLSKRLYASNFAVLFCKGCQKAIHFTLAKKCETVYAPGAKGKSIYFRHFSYDFRAYFADNFAVYHAEKIVCKDCLSIVYPERAENIFVQNVRFKIGRQFTAVN